MSRARSIFLSLCVGFVMANFASPSQAMPATSDYQCQPTLPRGDRITVDFNSGGNSITVAFPNGQSIRMPKAMSGSGFRYSGQNVVVYGKGETTITLEISGQPSRQCVRLN